MNPSQARRFSSNSISSVGKKSHITPGQGDMTLSALPAARVCTRRWR